MGLGVFLVSLSPWSCIAQFGGCLPEQIRTTYHSLLFILIPVRENPNFETHVVSY